MGVGVIVYYNCVIVASKFIVVVYFLAVFVWKGLMLEVLIFHIVLAVFCFRNAILKPVMTMSL
jgi:hypothetical protein